MGYLYYICATIAEFGCEWVCVIAESRPLAEQKLKEYCEKSYNEYRANWFELDVPVWNGQTVKIIN